MKFNSRVVRVLATSFLMVALVGCGTTAAEKEVAGETNGGVAGQTDEAKTGIVEGGFITLVENPSDRIFKLKVRNDSENELPLTYGGQQYEYQIKDKQGEVLYTYSMDKGFTMEYREDILKPGEEKVFDDIDISEGLINLEAGTYDVEIWSVADQVADQKTTFEYVYTGATGQLDLPAQFITIVGYSDNTSLEATNDEGESEVFRLSQRFIDEGYDFKEGVRIEIQYSINDANQKVIEEVLATE
ncbi:BsuPI-related putative proteinase inhibitor [Bacillus sp. JJ1562]|uniref:BsuPI-related putative proteinase inhibitor n=1 Tax=Bacillus sp. JJ1562 TaxID=3122960 RepID=UPI0030014294